MIRHLLALIALAWGGASAAAAQDPRGIEFFEKKIRPVLVQHCYECHSSATPKAKGGLLLDSRDGILKGGRGGAVLVPGKPEESSIVEALKHEDMKMPPKLKLPDAVIADFALWVKMGAPDPRTSADPVRKTEPSRWLTTKPVKHPVPAVRNTAWPASDLDRFVLAKLEREGIAPNPSADRVTLIRRLSFDLTGLPPTSAEIDAFVNDSSPKAIESVVDRLLGSRHFGERWGRHWLDVAHFAENSGVVKYDQPYPHAFRYRDWVIDAFHQDKPYDQFVREQIAGDLLPADSDSRRDLAKVGTGFLVMGRLRQGNVDLQSLMDNIDEQIDAVTQGFLGLTVSCARCHDHKFDPISIKDYYALAGIFRGTSLKLGGKGGGNTVQGKGKNVNACAGAMTLGDGSFIMGVVEGSPADCQVCVRGDVTSLGDTVPRGLPEVFHETSKAFPIKPSESGRLQLAQWIGSADNPLTARVMVNRVWHHLFGRGLVPSVDNFGAMSEPCSHPELLDSLAANFVDDGWSVKRLIRSIVLSKTYQVSGEFQKASYDRDPENLFLWRRTLRRLDAEAIRDSMLTVAGTLNADPLKGTLAGQIALKAKKKDKGPSAEIESAHRSVYLPVVRENVNDMMRTFDFADPSLVFGKRDVTTVPTQALFLMNNGFVVQQSDAAARRLLAETSLDDAGRVALAFRLALGRTPSAVERDRAIAFLAAGPASSPQTWSSFCQALFQSAEFRYVR